MAKEILERATLGRPWQHRELDANLNRLLHFSSIWQSGETYTPQELVFHEGALWVCEAATGSTTEEPRTGQSDWGMITPNPGVGSVSLSTPQAMTLGAGWTTAPFDNEFHPPYFCSFDLAANTFALAAPGIWQIGFYFNISHNEANQSRGFDVRLFDVTDNAPYGAGAVRCYVGRNIYGTHSQFIFRLVIDYDHEGHDFRLEIGNADGAFSATNFEQIWLDLQQITPRVYPIPI